MRQLLGTARYSGLPDSPQGVAPHADHDICFTDIWDARNATFRPCYLPVASAIPAASAAVILLFQALTILVPWRPLWTRPFIEECPKPLLKGELDSKGLWTRRTATLAFMSALALILSLTFCIKTWSAPEQLLHPVTWLVILGLVVIHRPQTAPLSILFILVLHFTTQAIILASRYGALTPLEVVTVTMSMVLAILSITIILAMPLRKPEMSVKEISQIFTAPTSLFRSPEDNLSPWHFMTVSWMTPLIRLGSKRQLQDGDVWQLGYEFQHQRLHDNFRLLKGTVIRRLVQANSIDLWILTFLGTLEMVANYSVPVLLQKLLASMEDAAAPRQAAVSYAALSLAVRLVACQSGVFSLWYGRRCYERSRGEMITMLYEKTLGRKIAFPPADVEPKVSSENGVASAHKSQHEVSPELARRSWSWFLRRTFACFPRSRNPAPVKQPASMGKILNLMRNDVYEVAQRFWEFQSLITKPLSAVFSIALVINLLGLSASVAVLLLICAQALNGAVARIMIHYERKRRVATDTKLQVITQFVEAIRHLRWYGWQSAWLTQIMDARQRELNLRIVNSILNVIIGFISALSLDLSPVVAFMAYTVIAGKPLRIDIIFPAMQLFSMMTSALRDLPNLITVIINAWVAVGRIEEFMAEPDKQDPNLEATAGDTLELDHASFAWPGSLDSVLGDLSISFPTGLTVICGEVGSGKTALMQALLGELDTLEGHLVRPTEPVGYCAQTPWLQSMSIRENILFSAPYDENRYKEVIAACALTSDLEEFKGGDLSFIGENGIGLSGGQRARVALARAVYSDTKVLLLDDPLSALDQQTAEAIVQHCFAGPLFKDRTVVLVTHRTDLVVGLADQVIKMQAGRATLLEHDDKDDKTYDNGKHKVTTSPDHGEEQETVNEGTTAAIPDKFIEEEHRAHGSVQLKVYWEYIKAGKLRLWALLIVTLTIFRAFAVGEAWFLKVWGEAYDTHSSLGQYQDVEKATTMWRFFDKWPRPDVDVSPWLFAFFFLALGQSLFLCITQGVTIIVVYVAAKRMFREIMDNVAHATFRFYDVTPVGRLMNRVTSDMGVIDGNIGQQLQTIAWFGVSWISSVIVIASVTPTFLVFSACLGTAFVAIFMRFLPTSQSLRRLEMVSLTPLMSNFGALLNGLTTVRAFCAQGRFQDRVIDVVDTFQKMDHFYWSLQAWLMYRYDALSSVSTFLITMLALVTDLSPGLTAFVLLAANKFVTTTHGLCKQYGQLQMEFVSVERVIELVHLEQESKGDISPPAWWPSFSGDIVFDQVVIRYAPHMEPALNGITFRVKGGSKTAIIGRTGSGKSTLALALIATVLPSEGKITVDNLNLADVDKQLLRSRVTFLAQDPVLFPGTMRQNLDPVQEHTDDACETVLRRVCERQGWTLDTEVEDGGRNLSQGQRQLVGLARAVLRRSAIIILDEATASIDRESAMQIQQVMHEEMTESTVITIAHRLEAVRNADYCIVLGQGQILEQGPAEEMLKQYREDLAPESNVFS